MAIHPVFLPGESQGRGSLVGYRLWGRPESDTTEATYTNICVYISNSKTMPSGDTVGFPTAEQDKTRNSAVITAVEYDTVSPGQLTQEKDTRGATV